MSDVSKDLKYLAGAYDVIAKSLNIALNSAARLLDSLLNNPDTKALADMIIDVSKDPNHTKNDFLVGRELDPSIIGMSAKLLKRENTLAAKIINMDPDDKASKNILLYFNSQKEKVEALLSESLARTGTLKEMERAISDTFVAKLKDNPMCEVTGLTIEKYEELLLDISKLKFPMNRITLFPRHYEENGQSYVDVGFLNQTQEFKTKNRGIENIVPPYSIPNLVKGLLVKQQLLENSNGSIERNDLFQTRINYRDNLLQKYLNQEQMKLQRRNISKLYTEISEMNIEPLEKKALLDLIKKSVVSEESKRMAINAIHVLKMKDGHSIEHSIKGRLIDRLDDVSEAKYMVSASISQEGKDLIYSIDLSNYARIGAAVNIRTGEKTLALSPKNMGKELDYFMKGQINSEEKTILMLTQSEFDKAMSDTKNRKYKKEELQFLKNHEEKIAETYKKMTESRAASEKIRNMINENKSDFAMNSIPLSKAFETDELGKNVINQILEEQKETILAGFDNQEIIQNAIEYVEDEYPFIEVCNPYYLETEIKESQEMNLEKEPELNPETGYLDEQGTPYTGSDSYFDRDQDGIDDRDQ